MDHKRILAVFTTMLCLLQTASAQECNLPTSDIIKGLLGDSIRQVISTLFDPGFDIDINTVLQDFSITCLAVSGSRDLYKASSSLVEFSFTGTIQFAGGNPQALDNFNGCEANAKCFALFNIECDGMDRWRIRPSPFVPQSIRVLPDFNDKTELSMNKTRLDCGTCGEQIILDRYPNDRETNCFCKSILIIIIIQASQAHMHVVSNDSIIAPDLVHAIQYRKQSYHILFSNGLTLNIHCHRIIMYIIVRVYNSVNA